MKAAAGRGTRKAGCTVEAQRKVLALGKVVGKVLARDMVAAAAAALGKELNMSRRLALGIGQQLGKVVVEDAVEEGMELAREALGMELALHRLVVLGMKL